MKMLKQIVKALVKWLRNMWVYTFPKYLIVTGLTSLCGGGWSVVVHTPNGWAVQYSSGGGMLLLAIGILLITSGLILGGYITVQQYKDETKAEQENEKNKPIITLEVKEDINTPIVGGSLVALRLYISNNGQSEAANVSIKATEDDLQKCFRSEYMTLNITEQLNGKTLVSKLFMGPEYEQNIEFGTQTFNTNEEVVDANSTWKQNQTLPVIISYYYEGKTYEEPYDICILPIKGGWSTKEEGDGSTTGGWDELKLFNDKINKQIKELNP